MQSICCAGSQQKQSDDGRLSMLLHSEKETPSWLNSGTITLLRFGAVAGLVLQEVVVKEAAQYPFFVCCCFALLCFCLISEQRS